MLKTKRDINQLDLKTVDLHLSNLDFHSLEVVNRVSETQLQVGGKLQLINFGANGLSGLLMTTLQNVTMYVRLLFNSAGKKVCWHGKIPQYVLTRCAVCCPSVCAAGTTSRQHWFNVSYLGNTMYMHT